MSGSIKIGNLSIEIANGELRRKQRGIEKLYRNFPKSCHPRMFLSVVQSEFRLDSR
jgi:hypothetical protein